MINYTPPPLLKCLKYLRYLSSNINMKFKWAKHAQEPDVHLMLHREPAVRHSGEEKQTLSEWSMKMRFHYVVFSHLFLLLMVWPLVGCTAASWIKSPITAEPIEVKFSTIQAWKIGLCQSDTDGPLSLALTVNHIFLIAIHALLSPSHTHTHTHTHTQILSISRHHRSVNISYWQDAACR